MKTRSKRMEPVAQLAKNRERKAATELGESRRTLGEHQQRLDELYHYREDYIRTMQSAGAAGLDAARMRDYRSFLVRLDTAIEQQKNIVVEGNNQVEHKVSQWCESRTKTKVMDKVVERIRDEEMDKIRRQEQKAMDEQSLRKRRPI